MIILSAIFVAVGTVFCLVAALGILRFPDVYTRLHAASNAGPLGAGMILLGVAFVSTDWWISARCVLGFLFLIATSPVSAHLLARAALKSGIPPASSTQINEYDPNH